MARVRYTIKTMFQAPQAVPVADLDNYLFKYKELKRSNRIEAERFKLALLKKGYLIKRV